MSPGSMAFGLNRLMMSDNARVGTKQMSWLSACRHRSRSAAPVARLLLGHVAHGKRRYRLLARGREQEIA